MEEFFFRCPQRWNAEQAASGYFQEPPELSDSTGGYGATVARLTPDQKVGSSNLSALIFYSFPGSHACPTTGSEAGLQGCGCIACDVKGLLRELNPGPLAP